MKKYILIYFFLIQFSYAGSYGGLLLHGNCITCHEINTHKSAPSLKYIKKVYKSAFENKKDFVAYMSDWVEKPNKEGSLMHNMIEKYDLMPELAYDKDTLNIIAQYIYETDLDKE